MARFLAYDPVLQQRCRTHDDSSITITDENGLLHRETDTTELRESHTDRFGQHWVHVTVDLGRLPLGATPIKVTACGESVLTKVYMRPNRELDDYNIDGYVIA